MPIRPAAGTSEYPVVVTDENPPAGIDVTRPSVARVYDYWLGGKDNFASDREMGGRMAEVNPALPQLVRHNREFICAAAARGGRDLSPDRISCRFHGTSMRQDNGAGTRDVSTSGPD